jgi:hypothetical protein
LENRGRTVINGIIVGQEIKKPKLPDPKITVRVEEIDEPFPAIPGPAKP